MPSQTSLTSTLACLITGERRFTMNKVIFSLVFSLIVPSLAFAQWQSNPNYIIVTPNPGANSSTYVTNTGNVGQIRHYPGVDVITPYPCNEVVETQILLNNLHKGDGLRSLPQKHVPGFVEDDD